MGKDKPEEFSKESICLMELSRAIKSNEEQCINLSKLIKEIKASLHSFNRNVLSKLDLISDDISLIVERFIKGDLTETKGKVKDARELIKEVLLKAEAMSFTEILEATKITAPTLSKHLSKMVEEEIVERTETDKKVLYRLKL